jgi:hypothetical protein
MLLVIAVSAKETSIDRAFQFYFSNNFLLYGPSWSGVGDRVLSLACSMPYDKELLHEKYPEVDMGGEFPVFFLSFPAFQGIELIRAFPCTQTTGTGCLMSSYISRSTQLEDLGTDRLSRS